MFSRLSSSLIGKITNVTANNNNQDNDQVELAEDLNFSKKVIDLFDFE